ncbi:MAG TPA: formate dehydrogenase accessory sulfurtransferase FdhD [Puia sp.]|nr:formate dehydrogenase accessory sulfurtransferase FdhD [Puia sp.]
MPGSSIPSPASSIPSPASPPGITILPVHKIQSGQLIETTDPVAVEQPLEIRLQYGPSAARIEQNISLTMRTPGHDTELALGFLFSEGILPGPTPIIRTRSDPDSILICLHESFFPDLSRTQRSSYTNSSCGVCGKLSIDALRRPQPAAAGHPSPSQTAQSFPHTAAGHPSPTAQSFPPISADLLFQLPQRLRASQDIFDSTGGLHAAALFDHSGQIIVLREDIGRHNALDKLIGYCFLRNSLPETNSILILSGRACFELIQKAATAGITIIAAVGPPSSLAVQAAEESGITLVGFLRDRRCNIYSGAHRIRS